MSNNEEDFVNNLISEAYKANLDNAREELNKATNDPEFKLALDHIMTLMWRTYNSAAHVGFNEGQSMQICCTGFQTIVASIVMANADGDKK